MIIIEIAHLPDGYDATVEGDGGRLVLHFLSEPSQAEIEALYTLYTTPVENEWIIEAENGETI